MMTLKWKAIQDSPWLPNIQSIKTLILHWLWINGCFSFAVTADENLKLVPPGVLWETQRAGTFLELSISWLHLLEIYKIGNLWMLQTCQANPTQAIWMGGKAPACACAVLGSRDLGPMLLSWGQSFWASIVLPLELALDSFWMVYCQSALGQMGDLVHGGNTLQFWKFLKCVRYEIKFYTVYLNKLSIGVVGWQAFLYSELSSCPSKAKALLFLCFICLSLYLEDQVNFPRPGEQAEGNAIEKEVEYDACLYWQWCLCFVGGMGLLWNDFMPIFLLSLKCLRDKWICIYPNYISCCYFINTVVPLDICRMAFSSFY